MDFLAENNSCGQTLLQIVSQGNAILAELTRLSSMIPPQLSQDRYSEIILDFSYFKTNEAFEKKLDADTRLQDMDEVFKETHLNLLSKFYLVFECVHQYTIELSHFLAELDENVFIQQSLETVLNNVDGKQLLAEALYICGVMLLYIDEKFEGSLREKILVLYYRYSAQRSNLVSNVDDVCRLFRSTGYVARKARPQNYPEEYFKRVGINSEFVTMLIGRLRSDDIYNQVPLYPQPVHRSVALANQAALIYVALFFDARILHHETAIMREVVDKYFADNWVIATYMGNVVNLIDAWEPYRAARSALQNVQDLKTVQTRCDEMHAKVGKLIPQVDNILKEGVLTENMVLEKLQKLFSFARDCNVTLRWLMLHTAKTPELSSKRAKQMRDIVLQKHNPLALFSLLLNTAEFEHKFKEVLQQLLKHRQQKWDYLKKESSERLRELSEAYSGERPLYRVEKIERLQKWFDDISKQVDSLSQDDPVAVGRRIVQLINALEQVQGFHQIEGHAHIRQCVQESRQQLHKMLRLLSIKDELLAHLDKIADVSYAWLLVDAYTAQMQGGIKENPKMVVKLRATFLKLASALDLPLLRIIQASSKDMEAVSAFYSNELIGYIRRVLHIIPETMFTLLARIIHLQTNCIKQLPTRLMKDQLKEYAQLDERAEVAKLTHDISVFTDGVLEMKTTLVGIVEIDPRQLLEDGIRKELVNQLSLSLHNGLIFAAKPKPGEMLEKLTKLTQVVSGYHRSFEYVQDYIGIRGLKMFQEEFSRIVNYNVEQECNAFLRQQIHDWESEYQSKKVPIPKYAPLDTSAVNFIGRLTIELIRLTDPTLTVYVDSLCTWYDRVLHTKVLILSDFAIMLKALGAVGMVGLDRLLSFRIRKKLQDLTNTLNRTVDDQVWSQSLGVLAQSLKKTTVDGHVKLMTPFIAKVSKLHPNLAQTLMAIGQMTLLRRHISHELKKNAKFSGKNLAAALRALNDATMLHLPERTSLAENDYLERLASHLKICGIYDPLKQIYIQNTSSQNLPLFLALSVISSMPKFTYSRSVGCLVAKGKQTVDCVPFTYGIFVFLTQFHTDYTEDFVKSLCTYIKSASFPVAQSGKVDADLANLLTFLDFASIELGCVDRGTLLKNLPEFILTQYKDLLTLGPEK